MFLLLDSKDKNMANMKQSHPSSEIFNNPLSSSLELRRLPSNYYRSPNSVPIRSSRWNRTVSSFHIILLLRLSMMTQYSIHKIWRPFWDRIINHFAKTVWDQALHFYSTTSPTHERAQANEIKDQAIWSVYLRSVNLQLRFGNPFLLEIITPAHLRRDTSRTSRIL